MSSTAVTVAVRCRPLSAKELREKSESILTMEGQQTTIVDPQGKTRPLSFSFDYSFWSAGDPTFASFASQETVFNSIGRTLLDNAFQGYNGCLFAYGQTGSGKTYTMMGYGEERGVIPRLCSDLFRRANERASESGGDWCFNAEVSYLEIYNERCRCLLTKGPAKGEYRVREHPTTGPYVENLAKVVVTSYKDIERVMEEGNKSRTVAATAMNATSSRSHAIFTISFYQRHGKGEEGLEMSSKINLVDLAGSERVDKTGATGDTLKEGSNINKSLTTLGLVIHSLADHAASPKDSKAKKHVPFRDSSLTWLLKENLCGNSKTIMLAALSPAATNYDETVSTLRYADRAKNLRTVAVVNEDPTATKIKELTAEVERLKSLIADGASPRQSVSPGAFDLEATHGDYELLSTHKKLEETEALLNEQTKSWEDKAAASAALLESSAVSVNKTLPCLVNLNEDFLLSEVLVFNIQPGVVIVGSGEGLDKRRDIHIEGQGILERHAKLVLEGVSTTPPSTPPQEGSLGESRTGSSSPRLNSDVPCIVTIEPLSPDGKVLVNGKPITAPTILQQGDRIIFGIYHVFRYRTPFGRTKSQGGLSRDITFDYHKAMEERFEAERAAWLAQQPAVIGEDEHRRQLAEQQLKLDIMSRRVAELEEQAKRTHGVSTLQSTIAQSRAMESTANTASPLTTLMQLSGTKAQRLPPKQIFRYKIVLLGHQEVGKTSLRKCFQSDPLFFKSLPDVKSTTGIEVQQKAVKVGNDNVELFISDFAGQEMYHSHTLFLTDRSLFVLVWKISAIDQDFKSKGISAKEEIRMLRWIDEIYAKFPKASIAICATHLDELRDQSQRSVEFILGKVENIIRQYLGKIAKLDDQGKPIKPSLLGNFAVSCKNRTFIAAGQHKNLSGQKLSALLNVLAWECHRRCVNDEVFWGGAIPGRHIKLMQDVDEMKRDKDKMLLPLGEFVHLAVRDGIENDDELLQVSQLLHSWDVTYMFLRHSVSQNAFFFMHPAWMCRIAGVLFSFAHVLDTPYHLRSIIGGLEYTVTAAETADMGLMKVGWIRMPLVRVLFRNALNQFFGREAEDHEYELCVQILSALELIYRVDVPVEDEDVYAAEAPNHYGRLASPPVASPVDKPKSKVSRSVPRYFCPSLSPYKVPHELRSIAPLLFNRGVHIRFDFNMLPAELWWRLQYKLQRYIHPISILVVPKEEDEVALVLQEACEVHNRWIDGLWLSTSYARTLIIREGTHSIRLYSAETRPKGSDELLRAVEEFTLDLLEEYKGVSRRSMVSCPVQGCTGWHCVDELHLLAKDPEDWTPEHGLVEKEIHCGTCGERFKVSDIVVTGTSPLGPQIFPQTQTRGLIDLLQKSLDPGMVDDVCDFFGVRLDRRILSHSESARTFEIDFGACLDKIVHVTMMEQTVLDEQKKESDSAEQEPWNKF